jgi:hypothetical protein
VRFFEDDLNSPYRGPPTPDVEKRWSDLHNSRYIPGSVKRKGNINPDSSLVVSYRRMSYDELYESGGPESSIRNVDGTYPATIAAFHQMHCLVRLLVSRSIITRLTWIFRGCFGNTPGSIGITTTTCQTSLPETLRN